MDLTKARNTARTNKCIVAVTRRLERLLQTEQLTYTKQGLQHEG